MTLIKMLLRCTGKQLKMSMISHMTTLLNWVEFKGNKTKQSHKLLQYMRIERPPDYKRGRGIT